MAQNRYHDYYAEATTAQLNEHFDQVQRKCKVEGMEVTVSGNWQVTIGSGRWFRDGVVIEETVAVSSPLTISAASDQDRWDVVYGQYTYQATSPPPEATYGVKQGTPGASPTIPNIEANQVALAYIYIPSSASTLADCTIYQAYGLKEQIEMLLGIKVEGNVWVRADDPKVAGEWVKDGDFWLDTSNQTLYVWRASTESWVAPTIPLHASTHHTTGSDPLDVKDLADSLKFLRDGDYAHYATRAAHDALHILHSSLSDVKPDQHHARDHASRHMAAGGDPLPWGAGGGLDADMVDGYHASEFATTTHNHAGQYAPTPHGNAHHDPAFAVDGHTHPLGDITGPWGAGSGLDADMVDGRHANEFAPIMHSHAGVYAPTPHDNTHHNPAFAVEGHTHPLGDITGPWGAGSGLDADMVDGHHAGEFAPVTHDHTGVLAPTPHGNAHHDPAFAVEGHTHSLGDLPGTHAIGFFGPVQDATLAVPATGAVFWERSVPNLSISGTRVELYELRLHVTTAPSSNITYTFKRGGATIEGVTIPAGATSAIKTLSPAVDISSGGVFQIAAPTNGAGATGLDAQFVFRRVKA